MPERFYRRDGEVLLLKVRVQPGARSTEVTGLVNDELRVRVNAPATDGRANESLRKFLADQLGTAMSRVEIVRGAASRRKTVAVIGARRLPEVLLGH
ncbi:MAG TPA: DUF167 domain-containing protein [Gammaproteobacteria bacterium]|nr:DUF167 domain-containing protein [Gammaproteobacteria bacterium]